MKLSPGNKKRVLFTKIMGSMISIKYNTCPLFNSMAKPHLKALDSMLEEEEGEYGEGEEEEQEQEQDEEGEEEEEGKEHKEDLYRKSIEDEFSDDSDVKLIRFYFMDLSLICSN